MLSLPGLFVLRNLLPVGVFFYRRSPSGEVDVCVDYVIPQYRDRKNGEFLYRVLNERFSVQGLKGFRVTDPSVAHVRYLRGQGFERAAPDSPVYYKPII